MSRVQMRPQGDRLQQPAHAHLAGHGLLTGSRVITEDFDTLLGSPQIFHPVKSQKVTISKNSTGIEVRANYDYVLFESKHHILSKWYFCSAGANSDRRRGP